MAGQIEVYVDQLRRAARDSEAVTELLNPLGDKAHAAMAAIIAAAGGDSFGSQFQGGFTPQMNGNVSAIGTVAGSFDQISTGLTQAAAAFERAEAGSQSNF